jgi:hypothetical protein
MSAHLSLETGNAGLSISGHRKTIISFLVTPRCELKSKSRMAQAIASITGSGHCSRAH